VVNATAREATPRRRVLILHPHLAPAGGSEAVAAWMIQALKDSWDVAIHTWAPPDFDAINRWYGTSIRSSEVEVHVVPRAARRIVDIAPTWLGLLRYAILIRAVRRGGPSADAFISAENEAALGWPIIQYVHYPRFLRPRPKADLRWYHGIPGVANAYYWMCDLIVGPPADDMARSVTLVNSAWTAERMRAAYPSADITVVHPPVASDFPEIDWDRREQGFVCMGRLAEEKEAGTVIDILSAVRRVVPGIRLHFAGGRTTAAAFRRLLRLVKPHRSWIEIHEALSRTALSSLVAGQRYGIHGMPEEHFGIGPAEMVRAGCVVFLPAGGGQVEIVGGEPRLLYRTRDEAVEKIVRVLTDPGEQTRLRSELARHATAFSTERFVTSMREIADRFYAESRAGTGR
jgi:glycosyltransferase involved in cell wall biosynthesis